MADTYYTISQIGEGSYSEKRSRFIAYAHPVASIAQIRELIAAYRKKYYDARHICYAYMLGYERTDFRANDDGEPANTAGKPILGQINSHELTDILVVVVRYYGGILLGTGGLVKAYGNGVQQALLKLETVRKVLRENYRLQCEYEQFNTISHLLQDWDIEILEQQFSEKIVLRWAVNPAQVEQIQDSLTQRFAGRLVLEKEE